MNQIIDQEMVFISITMVTDMSGTGWKTKNMVREYCIMEMEIFMKGSLLMTSDMEEVSTFLRVYLSHYIMKGTFRMIKDTGLENMSMEILSMWASSLKIWCMEVVVWMGSRLEWRKINHLMFEFCYFWQSKMKTTYYQKKLIIEIY